MPDGILAHHTLTPEKPRQSRAANAQKPDASGSISDAALTVKAMIDRENYLDGKRETRDFTKEDGDEEDRLYEARMVLTEQIMEAEPGSTVEALIIVMHAADRMNFANAINEGAEILDACERAVRRSCAFLAQVLGVDLVPFGSENFLPLYLSELPAGRA